MLSAEGEASDMPLATCGGDIEVMLVVLLFLFGIDVGGDRCGWLGRENVGCGMVRMRRPWGDGKAERDRSGTATASSANHQEAQQFRLLTAARVK
jgi:hypothetical protein